MANNFNLLFVEDDQETIEYIHELLAPYFDKVFIGYDGMSGLEAFRKHRPDMILTDINMPVMNGIEMIEHIRKTDPDIPVVFFTSASDTSLLLEAVNLGVDGFVVKPIHDTDHLLAPIQKILHRLNEADESQRLHNIIELQSREASLGEIVANISHQWRQPLNNIGLGLQDIFDTLESSSVPDLIDKDLKTTLLGQVTGMSEMLDEVRELFRRGDGAVSSVKVSELMDRIYSLYESAFVFDHIKFIIDHMDDITINVSRMNIIHAFINIINNSKHAMLNNTPMHDRYLFVSSGLKDNCAEIIVRDSGGGIDEEIIHRIFDPYVTSKHQDVGVGIGLYLTFQIIVNQSKGTIEAQNIEYEYDGKKLKGAEIIIRLPLKAN